MSKDSDTGDGHKVRNLPLVHLAREKRSHENGESMCRIVSTAKKEYLVLKQRGINTERRAHNRIGQKVQLLL
jgi:hypothetical protein